jgi:hypothetical protein
LVYRSGFGKESGREYPRLRVRGGNAVRCALALLILLLPAVAEAVPPLYLPDDVTGARSIGMGDAFRGVGTSNDAIAENPSTLPFSQHYEITGFFAWDTQAPAAYWNGSIADATLPLAVGLSYTHVGSGTGDGVTPDATGRYVGANYRLALAYPISQMISIGAGVNWLVYGGDIGLGNRGVNAVTATAAAALKLSDMFTITAIGYNLIPVETPIAPLRVALGAAFGTDTSFRIDVDGVATLGTSDAFDIHVGGEYFAAGMLAIRAGYFYSGLTETSMGSVGLGLIFPAFAVDAAYRNSINPWLDHLIVVDLKFFLPGD